jgi:hypothetical protein
VKCWKSKTSVASLKDQQRVGGLQGVSGGKLGSVSGGSGTEPAETWNDSDDSVIAGTGVYTLGDLRVPCVANGEGGLGPDDGEGQFSWEG